MDERIVKEILDGGKKEVFAEALEYLEKKAVIPFEVFKKLEEQYRSLAFSVSGYSRLEVLNRFLEELQNAVKEGTTVREFRENMSRFLEEEGYDGLTPYHADMIFRQNMQTAFSVGHYRQMTDPDVLERRKYWQYQTAGDSHVRETHMAMDGRVFPADSKVWDTWYPPNGFGCRCTVVSKTEEQVKRMGLQVENDMPKAVDLETGEIVDALPDPKFRTNPAKAEWKPDLSGYPKALRNIFEDHYKAK